MISINGTLLVQIASFLWVWWFLDKKLLRPVVDIIEQEASVQNELERALDQQKTNLAKTTRLKEDRWYNFKLSFARATPSNPHDSVACNLPEEKKYVGDTLTDQEKASLERATVKLVVERINHEF